jgi:ABC-type transport system involved in multi-copper enzyme maturation permease subunit
MNARGIAATIRFEILRSLRPSRLIWWILLALFPLLVAEMFRSMEQQVLQDEREVGFLLYVLVVRMLCPLSLLLWATPAIHAEIEGRTWGYIAVRPGGRTALLLGKYVAAVAWATVLGCLSVTLFLLRVFPQGWSTLWGLLVELVFFSSLTYGALYLLIGVLFLKRGMVIAVSYTLLVEVFLTLIPAVVNRATVDYRLRSLLFDGLGLDVSRRRGWSSMTSDAGPYHQILVLGIYAGVLLLAAFLFLRRRQLVVAEE